MISPFNFSWSPLLVAGLLTGCASTSILPDQFGVVAAIEESGAPCVTLPSPAVTGERLVIILLPSQMSLGVAVAEPIGECGYGQEPGFAYRLRLDRPIDRTYGLPAFRGIVPASMTFRQCAGNEGLHLTAWERGRRVWRGSYYLGYDVEPDCTSEEVD